MRRLGSLPKRGLLWQQLRCQKQRRKRYGKADRRGIIPNHQSIEQRPDVVEERSQIGAVYEISARKKMLLRFWLMP